MPLSKRFLNFNKQILFGEVGSILGAQLFSHLGSWFVSRYAHHSFFYAAGRAIDLVSFLAIVGSLFGSSLWLIVRIYDEAKEKNLSQKKIREDVLCFTPIAFLLACILYYPILYFFSEHFLRDHFLILSSVFISQVLAFLIYFLGINIYREILLRVFKKEL